MKFLNHKFGFILLLVLIILVLSTLTRIVLLIYSGQHIPFSIDIFYAFFIGLVYDLVLAGYYIPIIVLFIAILPNRWLPGNGLYELFAAYRNNELEYETFYNKIDNTKAFTLVRNMLKTPEATFTSPDVFNLERTIRNPGPEKNLYVILISVESMSASFLGAFGNTNGITPKLDSLAQHSLHFTNLYATGTRTVRGLEALSLAIPPTPGQSIVRRPKNENLFTLGTVFSQHGYETKFIYGGYGYFDNMNYFFSNNSYDAIDRVTIPKENIHFENVWGVADEDLFTFTEGEADKAVDNKKPFFLQVMTTSNHRPFTYPDNRIDIPSHTGRNGPLNIQTSQ